jgi:DNA polymerase-1
MAPSTRRSDRPLLYLIDASSYVYRAYHAVPQLQTSRGVPTNAVYGLTTMLLKFVRDIEPTYAVAVFDAPGATFRDELYAEYKANRPPPAGELVAQFPTTRRLVPALGLALREESGVEADDVIGTLARCGTASGADVVIVTGDKDMMQLVNDHVSLWDPMRDRWTRLDDVRARFGLEPPQVIDVMALMGDAVDNVPGVAGIGEKTALALIRTFGSLETVLAGPGTVGDAGIRGAARVAAALEREADVARMSRELVTIRCDLDLSFDLEACRFRGCDADTLVPLLNELEFFSLVKEFTVTRAPLELRATTVESAAALAAAIAPPAMTLPLGPAPRLALAARWSSPRSMEAELTDLGAAVVETEAVVLGVDGDAGTAEALRALAGTLHDEAAELVGDDLKPLMAVAARHGVVIGRRLFDTRIASYLLNPTLEGHDVAALAERFLDATLPTGPGATGAQATAALRLRPILERDLEACEALSLFRDVEMPLLRILADMERRGMLVDVAALAALSSEYAGKLAGMVEEIHALAGETFNIQSPPQLRTVLFEKLKLSTRGVRRGKTGLSTDVDVLRRLAKQHPLPERILEYRALSKLMSTYVDALPRLVSPETGRVHTCFHQAVAATGRLSSSDPNLQNIPVRGEEGRRIRAAFTAPPGRCLVSADYSQIELRILAHLSGDAALVDAFLRDEDIHARTAAEVFGGLGGLTEEKRRAAKAINFGIIYGMGPARLARELEIPHDEAVGYIAEYFSRYPGVRAYVGETVAGARRLGYVQTLLNRRRYLPEIGALDGAARQFAERTAVNTPIQGSAADLIKVAMQRVDRRLRQDRLDAGMVLQVHDELVFECADAVADAVAAAVRAEMEGVAELAVPLRVDVHSGPNWAEAH